MISEILYQTVDNLDHCFNDPHWYDLYYGEFRERIIRLRDEAQNCRITLDTTPGGDRQ
jgi:hypothetical protein